MHLCAICEFHVHKFNKKPVYPFLQIQFSFIEYISSLQYRKLSMHVINKNRLDIRTIEHHV